jgi:DNA repair exonuclease SbcCD ATPase subunit
LQEANLGKEQTNLQNQLGAIKAKIALCKQEIEFACEQIAALLSQRKRAAVKNYTARDLIAVWPLLESYSTQDQDRLSEEQERLEKELSDLEQQEQELNKHLTSTGAQVLDLEQARKQLEQLERHYQTKQHGLRLIEAADKRLMSKIMPRTEHYMQQILPLLTSGRYHDVHLKEDQSDAPQLEVWEAAAGEYVTKSELSGGAADQLSLALRLAFTMAVLPDEDHQVPGFVILDEPLSSFDRGRAKALLDVITGEMLSRCFEQILLISNNSAFDPAQFPYHLYMENGVVAESNLPVVPEIAPMLLEGKKAEETPLPESVQSTPSETEDAEPVSEEGEQVEPAEEAVEVGVSNNAANV